MKRTLCALVAAVAVNFGGCNNSYDKGRDTEVLNGVPVSVAESYAQYGGSLSIVVKSENRMVLAYSYSTNTSDNARGEALVLSVIMTRNL